MHSTAHDVLFIQLNIFLSSGGLRPATDDDNFIFLPKSNQTLMIRETTTTTYPCKASPFPRTPSYRTQKKKAFSFHARRFLLGKSHGSGNQQRFTEEITAIAILPLYVPSYSQGTAAGDAAMLISANSNSFRASCAEYFSFLMLPQRTPPHRFGEVISLD